MPYAWYKAWPPGYYQTYRAQSGTIWAQVLPRSHGRRSTTVQPYRSVFPGRPSYQMEQSRQKAMPQWQLPCEQWERPPQYSSHNYSRLHCLITLAQIAEGKKLVEPAEVFIENFFWSVFLGSRILWSSWWWSSGVYWVLSQPTQNFTLDYTHFCKLQQQNEWLLALQVIIQTTKPTYN